MKKILIAISIFISVSASSQTFDSIRNFQWNSKNEVKCFYQLCDTCMSINRQIDNDSLDPEFSTLKSSFETSYKITGDSILKVLYQNKSESFTGYERCWVIYKIAPKRELKLQDLSIYLQYKYYYMAEKLKKVIKNNTGVINKN